MSHMNFSSFCINCAGNFQAPLIGKVNFFRLAISVTKSIESFDSVVNNKINLFGFSGFH